MTANTLEIVLLIIAALLLLLESFRVPSRITLGWLGLAVLAVAILVPLVGK